jgi:UDP-N-acetylmuramyl pentapeptide phosphotransferase/UDP-N-acetylglucosamine-1-phosphate transferase
MMIYLLSALAAFVVTFLATRYLSSPGSWFHVADQPNHRSLHSTPTPSSGGLAILLGLLAGLTIVHLAGIQLLPAGPEIFSGFIVISAASYWDDRRNLSQGLRLFFQFAVAIIAVASVGAISQIQLPGMGVLELAWLAVPFSIIFVIWMMNLYNFMDGMDGFAAGMGAIGFATLAIVGWTGGAPYFAGISLMLAMANIGFLAKNFPPAKIFMGDVGAVPMGYMVAVLAIWGNRDNIFEIWLPLLVFAPFILDATVTVIRRMYRGEKVWIAHSSHYYQRLVKAGRSHKQVVMAEYVVMLACSVAALVLHFLEDDFTRLLGVAVATLGFLTIFRVVDKIAPMPPRAPRIDS